MYEPVSLAQGITTGVITGTVVDPSGAAVANAQITAKSDSEGTERTTASSAEGGFSFYALPAGTYAINVSAPGFSTAAVLEVPVNSGATSGLGQIQLKVSASAAEVEVNGSLADLLQTTDSQVTTTLSAQMIQNLPLNNGFDTATELIPGVSSAHGDLFANANGDDYSVNGQSSRYNNSEIDGQSNNDNSVGGSQIFFGNPDAIQEIQIITNNFGAQYGRNAGAVVNYVTKSGSNAFHGSGFEYYQGQFLSSLENQEKNPAFGVCAPGESESSGCSAAEMPRFVENRFGGVLGGPIYKNKVFFFGSTYWDRWRQGAAPASSLPLLTPDPTGLEQLANAFPGNPAVGAITSSGPYSVKAGNPQPVPASSCPGTPGPNGSCMETVMGPGGTSALVEFAGVQRNIATAFNDQEELGRLDFEPGPRDHLFFRYFYQNEIQSGLDPGEYGGVANGDFNNVTDTAQSIGGDWTHTFTPRLVDQLRYSFMETKAFFADGSYAGCTAVDLSACPAQLVFANESNDDLGFGVNVLFPQGRIIKVTQVQNNASLSLGNHTFLFGGEFDLQKSPNFGLSAYNGELNYQSFSDFLQNGSSGDAYLSLANGSPSIPFTEPDVAAYFQDDWKVTPTFTTHIGLRWEYFGQAVNELHNVTVARESNPATAFWNPSLPLAARTVPAVNNFYKGFEPRIGFAWNPEFDKKLVIRGGYAINENPAFYNLFAIAENSAPSINAGYIACGAPGTCLPGGGSLIGAAVRAANLSSLPQGGDPRTELQESFPANFRPPYVQTYTLGIQHQIGRAVAGEIRYVGSKTTKDFQSTDHNPFLANVAAAFPGVVSAASLCQDPSANGFGRPDCDYSNVSEVTNGGWANYNGLQLNLRTQNYHGLTMTASYTRSKDLDNATDGFRSTGGPGSTIAYAQNPLNTSEGERGLSGNDFPDVVGVAFTYNLPRLPVNNSLLSRITNGFTLSSVYRFNSGQVYTPFQPINLDSNTGDTSFCDGNFNSQSVGADTCRLIISNRKAPLNSVAYLNPYTGPFVNGSPTQGTPEYVVYNSDGYITNPATGTVTGYNPGTPIDPKSAYWIIDNRAYAMAVGNPYPGSSRGPVRGQTYSDLDATIMKRTQLTERVQLELSFSAYNALNQMYLGTGQAFVGLSSFTQTTFNTSSTVPNPNSNASGNRFVLLGTKFIF
jgi:Carboxypeptidase regulatory-like domain/TonB-dependent Receptor Plug Domain